MAVYTGGFGTYSPINVPGVKTPSYVGSRVPFKLPGLAIILKKGRSLPPTVLEKITESFQQFEFDGKIGYKCEVGSKENYNLLMSHAADYIHDKAPLPNHLLNPENFLALLSLINVMSVIFSFMNKITGQGTEMTTEKACDPKYAYKIKDGVTLDELKAGQKSDATTPFMIDGTGEGHFDSRSFPRDMLYIKDVSKLLNVSLLWW
jgi:hypothetical protein